MRERSALRTAARVVAVAGVLLCLMAVRVVTSSRAELARGDRARAAGDRSSAIVAYRRAGEQYAPGNPYSAQALRVLEEMAEAAEAADDPEGALSAWRSLRGAVLASRSFYVPHGERRERAEAAIVRLTTAAANPAEREHARARTTRLFSRPLGPSIGWTFVLLLGWFSWTAGAFAFATLAIDEEDRVRSVPARVIGTIVVVGFGLFVIGMALA